MSIPEDIETIVKFSTALGIAAQLHSTRMTEMLARFDLTYPQFSILNHLSRRKDDGHSITAIAAAVEVKQPAVSKIIIKFEILNLVRFETTKDDARSKRVLITPAGDARLIEIQRALLPHYQALLDGWSKQETEQLTQQLFRLGSWMDKNRL